MTTAEGMAGEEDTDTLSLPEDIEEIEGHIHPILKSESALTQETRPDTLPHPKMMPLRMVLHPLLKKRENPLVQEVQ